MDNLPRHVACKFEDWPPWAVVCADVMRCPEVGLTCPNFGGLGAIIELRLHGVIPWSQTMDRYPRWSCKYDCLDPLSPSQRYQGSHLCANVAWQVHANGKARIASAANPHYEDQAVIPQTLGWNTMQHRHNSVGQKVVAEKLILTCVESPTLSLPFIETYTYLPYSCTEYPYISTQYFCSFEDAFHLSVLHQTLR